MSFRSRSKPGNPSKIVLPITPMLDMTFQLLFFFIVIFKPTPPDIEGEMEMALPSEKAAANPEKQVAQPKPHDPAIEFPADLTVKVRTQLDGVNDGVISAISIQDQAKETPVEGAGGDAALLKALKDALVVKREELAQKANIKVQGDGKLKVKEVIRVMDVCREAGFANVSMVPPDDFQR